MLTPLALSLVLLADVDAGLDPLRSAREAYGRKDYPAFLTQMRAAEAAEPTRPRVLLGLASAQALGGAPQEVAATLERLAAMGLTFAVEKEEDFAAIRDTPAFKAVIEHFAKNKSTVVGSAKAAFTLKDTELVEGVAFDAARNRYLVGSVRHRKVIAVDGATKRARDFVKPYGVELAGVFGLAIDASRQVLWVSTAWLPQVSGYTEAEKNRSGVLKLDLKTGAKLGSWYLPQDVGHVLGDLVVAANGDVFTTDSVTPAVYRVDGAKGGLEKWAQGPWRSPQGLAFSADGARLYVADYALGLFVIEVATKKVSPVKTPRDVASVGIDGLYMVEGALVATQNGIEPQRVMRFSLDEAGTSVTGQKVLLGADPRVDDLSLGTVVGQTLLINAHSGWSEFDDDGKRREKAERGSTFLAVPLR